MKISLKELKAAIAYFEKTCPGTVSCSLRLPHSEILELTATDLSSNQVTIQFFCEDQLKSFAKVLKVEPLPTKL